MSTYALTAPTAIRALRPKAAPFEPKTSTAYTRCVVPLTVKGVRTMKQVFTAVILPEDDWFVAQCLEVDIASQGETPDEALANLREALELYFEDPQPTIKPQIERIEIETHAA